MNLLQRWPLFLVVTLVAVGCQPASNRPTATGAAKSAGGLVEFEVVLSAVDKVVGKRFQAMQMDGMESVTYEYQGPLQAIVDVVAPIAEDAGFETGEENSEVPADADDLESQVMRDAGMESFEQVVFMHPAGHILSVSTMDVSDDDVDMQLLVVQLMNPHQTDVLGKKPRRQQAAAGGDRTLAEQWAEMGMYLPDQQAIEMLQADLPGIGEELKAALVHANPDVRQRAAYVLAEIGPDARGFGDTLFEQLKVEEASIARIYLIDALAAIRFDEEEVLEFLRSEYASLSDKNTPESVFGDGAYQEVDERINLAGALYVLSDEEARGEYFDFVTRWLAPPADDMGQAERNGYWARRWMAVNTLESMDDATGAIPLLEAMLNEPSPKSWVSVHVPRVLGALRD